VASAAKKAAPSPARHSTTARAPRSVTIRRGGTDAVTSRIRPASVSQIRSSANRIPNVCTERQSGMSSAVTGGIARMPLSPASRAVVRSATRSSAPRSKTSTGNLSSRRAHMPT
jgi:hypothetical protein